MLPETAQALVEVLDRRDVDPDVCQHICEAAMDALAGTMYFEDADPVLEILGEARERYEAESTPRVRQVVKTMKARWPR